MRVEAEGVGNGGSSAKQNSWRMKKTGRRGKQPGATPHAVVETVAAGGAGTHWEWEGMPLLLLLLRAAKRARQWG